MLILMMHYRIHTLLLVCLLNPKQAQIAELQQQVRALKAANDDLDVVSIHTLMKQIHYSPAL